MILAGPASIAALIWVAPATAAPVEPAPEPIADVWLQLAECESNQTWDANTGNGYFGGVQFSVRSWKWVGGEGMPHEAPPHVQVEMAERLLELQGWEAWPVCSRKLGLRP